MLLFIIFVLFLPEYLCTDFPSYFPRCHLNDPNMNECLLNATEILRPYIRTGIKEIELPPFDPLIISSFTVWQDSDMLTHNSSVWNFTVFGLDNYKFEEIKYDPNKLVLIAKIKFGKISFVTSYKMNARVIYFPVIGQGQLEADLNSTDAMVEIKGKLIKRRRRQYYKTVSAKIRMAIKGYNEHLTGLFDNNVELAHLTNELVKINGQALIDAATPGLEQVAEKFLMKFMQRLTRLYNYNEIFPN